MKRAVTEWGLVFSLVLTVAIGLIWVGSLVLVNLREPLLLARDLYVRIDNSQLCLFSELGPDWKPRYDGVEHKTISSVRRYQAWLFPGFEYQSRLFVSGRSIWSLEVSLVIPVSALVTLIAILWRVRMGGWLRRKPIDGK